MRIKDTFNPYKPMTAKDFWKSLWWIFLWGWGVGIPGAILEKNGVSLEVLIVIALLFVGGIQYLLFLFIIKRFRSMQMPPIWAIFIFIPPFNGLCFILAGFSSNSSLFRFLKKLVLPLKEVDHA